MPNIYYSTPSMGLASATQGFLSSLKDFKQLDLQEKALEARTKSEEESQRLREREADLREQGLELSALRELRLAQPKWDPELAQGAIEMMHEGIMEHMPGARYIRAQLSLGKMNPLDAIDRIEKFRDDARWEAAKINKRTEAASEAKSRLKKLRDEWGYAASDLKDLDGMVAEISDDKINWDIDPWKWEDEFEQKVALLEIAADEARRATQGEAQAEPAPPQQAPQDPLQVWSEQNPDKMEAMTVGIQQAKSEQDFNRILNELGGPDLPDEVVSAMVEQFASNPHNQLKAAKARLQDLKDQLSKIPNTGDPYDVQKKTHIQRDIKEIEAKVQNLEAYQSPEESLKSIGGG